MTIEFRRDVLTARYTDAAGEHAVQRRVDVRFDPLLGTSSRIAEGVRLPTAQFDALLPFQGEDLDCPFCPDRVERVTPRILPGIASEGRLRCGETLIFPNLVPYSQYAAVAAFPPRHWLSLHDFSPSLLLDNLTGVLDYIRRVARVDARVRYCAYNVNYLYPSGGSLPHPHSQVYVDPYPTTMMRLQEDAANRCLVRYGRSFWEDLVVEEERRGERCIGAIGKVAWMTPFAPLGFNEVRAVVRDRETLLGLTADDRSSLASGIARILAWYDRQGYNSFNLVLYSSVFNDSSALGVTLTMVTRSALVPYYRSDAMYFERLHWEAAVDRTPEEVASRLRPSFQTD
jgi:galactose-1-phosphate uridylyltransferase